MKWMQFINLHGALSSHYLKEWTIDEAKSDHFSDQIKKLFRGGYVYRPVAQRLTEYPDGKFHVYDLTPEGEQYLKDNGLWVDSLRPRSYAPDKWVHQFMISCVTASMHIMCKRNGYRYIPPHEYLQGKNLAQSVGFMWDGEPKDKILKPDSVFAIDYGNESYITYFVEADRSTEPNITKSPDRKSDKRSILQYQQFVGKKQYQKAYDRKSMACVLFVTVTEGHAKNFLENVQKEIGACDWMLVGVENAFETPYYPPKVLTHLFDEPLQRAGRDGFTIKKV